MVISPKVSIHLFPKSLSKSFVILVFFGFLLLKPFSDRHYANGEKKYNDGLQYLVDAGEGLYSRFAYMMFFARNSYCPYRKAGLVLSLVFVTLSD